MHWKAEYKKTYSQDMTAESLESLQSTWQESFSSLTKCPADDKIAVPHLKFSDQDQNKFIALTDAGGIGIIFTIYDSEKRPVKSIRLISGMDEAKAQQFQTYYQTAKEAEENCELMAGLGEMEVIDDNSQPNGKAIIEPQTHIPGQTAERLLLSILQDRDDTKPLERSDQAKILKLFSLIAKSLEEAHQNSFAHVGVKLDNYILDPNLTKATRININTFAKAELSPEDPFFGSYILKNFSYDDFNATQPGNKALAVNDTRSLAILFIQALLGKKDQDTIDLLYQGIKLPEGIDSNWLTEKLKGMSDRGLAHPPGGQVNDAVKQYSWNGEFDNGNTLRKLLETKLADLPRTDELITFLEDCVIYKQGEDGHRNLRLSSGEDLNTNKFIEVLDGYS